MHVQGTFSTYFCLFISGKAYSLDESVTTSDPVTAAINDFGHLKDGQGVVVVAVEIADCNNTVAAAVVVVGSMGSMVVGRAGVNGILDEGETEECHCDQDVQT